MQAGLFLIIRIKKREEFILNREISGFKAVIGEINRNPFLLRPLSFSKI